MTMITPSYLGETIEYSSLHACRSTLEDPTEFFPSRTSDALRKSLYALAMEWTVSGVQQRVRKDVDVRSVVVDE